MSNAKTNRIGKAIVGISLSLSIAVTGTMLAAPGQAHAATAASVSSQSSAVDKVISTGKKYMGVRYVFGAEAGRTDEFDCSSFTQYVFGKAGIELPRSSRQQSKVGTAVRKSQLQPGDLVFSDTNNDGVINHVSIYIGNGKLLHTYKKGVGVTISNFEDSTWDHTFVTARRVIKDNGQGGVVNPQPPVGNNDDWDQEDTGYDDVFASPSQPGNDFYNWFGGFKGLF